ncbi:MAG: DUF541 domain-containing protein [Anaerolineales bacterium]|nr:DUF541 domain-containing protein [Anaerolineales bacterium]
MKTQTTILKSIRIIPVFLVLALLVAGCASGNGTGLTEERQTLSATGYGQASGSPDLAQVQLGVSIVDPDIGRAINEANAAIENITNAVVAQGVSSNDVMTSYYSVWSEEVYDPQTGTPTGETKYHVDINLAITVREVHRMGDLIAVGLDAGATNVSGINFSIDDTAALEAEARTNAIADVLDRAEKLAQGLGMTLGDPISVGEGSAGAPGPIYSYGLKGDIGTGGGGVGAGVPSTISPGQTTIGVQVTVIYELLP